MIDYFFNMTGVYRQVIESALGCALASAGMFGHVDCLVVARLSVAGGSLLSHRDGA